MLASGKLRCPSNGKAPEAGRSSSSAPARATPQHLPYCSSECCCHDPAPGLRAARRRLRGRDARSSTATSRTPGHMEHFYRRRPGGSRHDDDPRRRRQGERPDGKLAVHLEGQPARRARDARGRPRRARGRHGAELRRRRGSSASSTTPATGRALREHARSSAPTRPKLVEELAHHEGTEILNLELPPGAGPARSCGTASRTRTSSASPTRPGAPASTPPAPSTRRWTPRRPPRTGCGAAHEGRPVHRAAAKRGEAVHPRAGDRAYPDFFLQRCTQCKRCTEECPFGDPQRGRQGYAAVQPAALPPLRHLHGLPARSASSPSPTTRCDAIAQHDQGDRGPRGGRREAAHPRADVRERRAPRARRRRGPHGVAWNPWVRVIPIRCLGSMQHRLDRRGAVARHRRRAS